MTSPNVSRFLCCVYVQVTGILDFGDTSMTWRVAEPAIMLCYVILMATNPHEAAMQTLVSHNYVIKCPNHINARQTNRINCVCSWIRWC